MGTNEFVVLIVDNFLANLLVTRMSFEAPESTEGVLMIGRIPAIIFGDPKFIIIVVVLDLVIAIAYIIEMIRTCTWSPIPPLDIMNDNEVVMTTFEGAKMFERYCSDADLKEGYLSEDVLLTLTNNHLELANLMLVLQFDKEDKAMD